MFFLHIIMFNINRLFSGCKHTTWETTIVKMNIKKSKGWYETAFCIPENFGKDARQTLIADASLPI